MAQEECLHLEAEWNYKGRFAACPCGELFADMTLIKVRAGGGRTRWAINSLVPLPPDHPARAMTRQIA